MDKKNTLLRSLPKVDEILGELSGLLGSAVPHFIIKTAIQRTLETERKKILAEHGGLKEKSRQQWLDIITHAINKMQSPNLRRVVNGTGVVIHTNLGRSILSKGATSQLALAGGYYTNLEFNLDSGKRGSRYSLVESLICDLTGAEAAIVVNNNAAAVFLALDSLASGREVIVSRGQLVEIGGSFRIPDVMAKSGARLVEVGATNRTHLYDYEKAITEETALLLRVHTSNFRIIGFTSEVPALEMVELAQKHELFTMEDLGSGCLVDLTSYGFPKEPTVQEIVSTGVDVVTFSGDKLLGGPQAGIIVGKREVIDKIKNNPLNRALRIDKFTIASLEDVLREYYDLDRAISHIPTLAMLTVDVSELKKRAGKIRRRLQNKKISGCSTKIVETVSRVGGGAFPDYSIASWAVEIIPHTMKISRLERELRNLDIPVIGRIEKEKYLLDVRTVQESEIPDLVGALASFFNSRQECG
ncbi:MAG: L-seryl-tRNA(Sec) selenium transferase [Deltaproteobacteria bacterium]|nr:L-seryl-tRNA(Sec) selenium transferase [Deltaproteobacteria bacterium]